MEEFMIYLRSITEENFIDAFHLNLAPGQERFVSHPIRSLAQAYAPDLEKVIIGVDARRARAGYTAREHSPNKPQVLFYHKLLLSREHHTVSPPALSCRLVWETACCASFLFAKIALLC